MPLRLNDWKLLKNEIESRGATLVAVSKTHPSEDIISLFQEGQRHFGENKVQELLEKKESIDLDIQWHMIGHVQTNKVKYMIPWIHLIHSGDRLKVLKEIHKRSTREGVKTDVLLQIKIAKEDSKYGFDYHDLVSLLEDGKIQDLTSIRIKGVMGMATFTDNMDVVRAEFRKLKSYFDTIKDQFYKDSALFTEISMGMSGDYQVALEEGSTMVRVGSLIFGPRNVTT